MSSSDLRMWVNDELHGITGISNVAIADFLVGMAEKSKSAQDFMQKIRDTDTLDVDKKNISDFAQNLYDKIPSNSGQNSGPQTVAQKRKLENRAKERAAMELAAKNRNFKMVSEDEEEEEIKPKKAKKAKKAKKEKNEDFEDGFDQMERERREDLEARDAYAKRL